MGRPTDEDLDVLDWLRQHGCAPADVAKVADHMERGRRARLATLGLRPAIRVVWHARPDERLTVADLVEKARRGEL